MIDAEQPSLMNGLDSLDYAEGCEEGRLEMHFLLLHGLQLQDSEVHLSHHSYLLLPHCHSRFIICFIHNRTIQCQLMCRMNPSLLLLLQKVHAHFSFLGSFFPQVTGWIEMETAQGHGGEVFAFPHLYLLRVVVVTGLKVNHQLIALLPWQHLVHRTLLCS